MGGTTFIDWLRNTGRLDEAWQHMMERQLAHAQMMFAEQWPHGEEAANAAKEQLLRAQAELCRLHDEYAEQMGGTAGDAPGNLSELRDLVEGTRDQKEAKA